jgi:TATA-box binding protein (TBP) (component of TFIID and TFIIIB)
MNATPLRVSTMTVTGDLGVIPDLQRLFDHGVIPYWWIGEGIIKIEFAGAVSGFCAEDILHTSTKKKKRFFNQSSLVFRLDLSGLATPGAPTPVQRGWKEINIKLFKNGGFQMTGINSEAMARAAITRLIAMHHNEDCGVWPTTAAPRIAKFNTCLINSDYAIDKAIRRDKLYHILVEEYGLWSTYEPTIYQGVNTKFFWNATRPADAPPGICVCPTPCCGEGAGYTVGDCKKITIAPFRTGKIIITGAKFMEQLHDAYVFMNDVFRKHAATVLRDPVSELPSDTTAAPAKKKPVSAPQTTESIIRQKMRASPRNRVTLVC